MEFFEEISKVKKDFPKVGSVTKGVKNYPLNFYQIFAIGMFVICFFLGIVFGNLFATCETTSYFYWFVSLLVSIFFFAIGHIIALLSSIDKKLR